MYKVKVNTSSHPCPGTQAKFPHNRVTQNNKNYFHGQSGLYTVNTQ